MMIFCVVKPRHIPVIDIIADIETSIQYKSFDIKKSIRETALPLLKYTLKHQQNFNQKYIDMNSALDKLKKHNTYLLHEIW